ncbi:MAG: hypothetical protein AAFN30_00245 [Actinomycetota bacterium]
MLVAVASRKGSPGVTTLAALLAAHWPAPPTTRLVVEADPSGGSLAARWSVAHGLTWDPGLLTLSTNRRPIGADLLPSTAQPVADGLWVAAAPPGADQVAAGLRRLADGGAAGLASAPDLVTVVDCGRLGAGSPSMPLARRAALVVMVCRPRLDEVHALLPAVGELRQAGCELALVTVGDRPYDPAEVAQAVGVELLGVVPVDERAAAAFDRDGLAAGRALQRSRLVGAVEDVVSRIQARCADLVDPGLSAPPPALGPTAPSPRYQPSAAPAPAPSRPLTDTESVGLDAPGPGRGAETPGPLGGGPNGIGGAEPDAATSANVEIDVEAAIEAQVEADLAADSEPDIEAQVEADIEAEVEERVAAVRRRLLAAGLDGPFSPAVMAARANAATQPAPLRRHPDG